MVLLVDPIAGNFFPIKEAIVDIAADMGWAGSLAWRPGRKEDLAGRTGCSRPDRRGSGARTSPCASTACTRAWLPPSP